jgi:hypothetical protein
MLVAETETPNTTRAKMNIVARMVAKDTLTRLPLSAVAMKIDSTGKGDGWRGSRMMANA